MGEKHPRRGAGRSRTGLPRTAFPVSSPKFTTPTEHGSAPQEWPTSPPGIGVSPGSTSTSAAPANAFPAATVLALAAEGRLSLGPGLVFVAADQVVSGSGVRARIRAAAGPQSEHLPRAHAGQSRWPAARVGPRSFLVIGAFSGQRPVRLRVNGPRLGLRMVFPRCRFCSSVSRTWSTWPT